ncbi:UNVERIFIED_CONTAM: hypothetical protein Scaly_2617500 [Sesamum calycinum]|uniref:Uncharacterized protein n=1 Tax=Sesamum calycinum TaxID=2727403 RepID=A0AAW2JD11_9LAMI
MGQQRKLGIYVGFESPSIVKYLEPMTGSLLDKISEVVLSKDSKRNEQDLEDSYEMSTNYAHNSLGWYRKEIEMNDIFAYYVAVEIMDEDDNDPQTMEECGHRNDLKTWKKQYKMT